MSVISHWFRFGKRVWISLVLGWFSFVLIFTPFVNLDQFGAIMICSAIVAEVLHEKRHRLFVQQIRPGLNESIIYSEVDVPGENRKDIQAVPNTVHAGKSNINTTTWALYHLAKDDEFYPNGESRYWDLDRTMQRLEKRLDYSIVVTAIVGTAIAAFG